LGVIAVGVLEIIEGIVPTYTCRPEEVEKKKNPVNKPDDMDLLRRFILEHSGKISVRATSRLLKIPINVVKYEKNKLVKEHPERFYKKDGIWYAKGLTSEKE